MASTASAKSQSLHNFALQRLKYESHARNCLENHDHQIAEKLKEKSKVLDSDHVANLNVTDNKGNDKKSRSKIMIKIPALLRNSGKSIVEEEENQVKIDEKKRGERFEGGEDDEPIAKMWNLRPRRSTKKLLNVRDGVDSGGGGGFVHEKKDQLKKEKLENGNRVRVESRLNGLEKAKKVKFSMALTRQEIEQDVYSLTGLKAARRPRKRTKVVQKNLDNVFPGLWLGSITPDSYKVSDHLNTT